MWLTAISYPEHSTINRFICVRLKDTLRSLFEEVVKLFAAEGLLSIEDAYTGGPIIEVNLPAGRPANTYTFV